MVRDAFLAENDRLDRTPCLSLFVHAQSAENRRPAGRSLFSYRLVIYAGSIIDSRQYKKFFVAVFATRFITFAAGINHYPADSGLWTPTSSFFRLENLWGNSSKSALAFPPFQQFLPCRFYLLWVRRIIINAQNSGPCDIHNSCYSK